MNTAINKNFLNHFKHFSWEKANQMILFITLVLLAFRKGDLAATSVPKPFEMMFVVLILSTILELFLNKKIKYFIGVISKKIWIALICLIGSVIIGWSMSIFIIKAPFHFEMVMEFARLSIAVILFVLILYYANNKFLRNLYLYALLFSVINIIFLVIPNSNFIVAGRFVGFTNNMNTLSKILIVPTMFFTTISIFERKNSYWKYITILISACLFALMCWAGSRGGLAGLFGGLVCLLAVMMVKKLSMKEIARAIMIIVFIILLGFALTPYSGKQVVTDRILNADTQQTNYNAGLKTRSLFTIIRESTTFAPKVVTQTKEQNVSGPSESRLGIWKYYLKEAFKNPLGEGPAFNLNQKVFNSAVDEYVAADAHSTYLEVLMWGGIIAFCSFLYLIYLGGQKIKDFLIISEIDQVNIAMAAILTALLIAMTFDSDLKFFWFWAVLALILKYD
jgi:hypothetical protein